jgi:hypothetical protein
VDNVRVNVSGIRELNAAFRKVDRELPRELGRELKGLAGRIASVARGKVTRHRGRAAGSVKARGSGQRAAIVAGGTAAPHYPWLDFGGSTKRHPGGEISRPYLGPPRGSGRYLWPTVREKRKDIEDGANDAVETVAKRAGFTVRGF